MNEIVISSPSSAPPGTFPAKLVSIEDKTSKRDGNPYRRWEFTALTAEGPERVSGVSSVATGPSSKAHRWLRALLGRPPQRDERISVADLEGRPCVVVLETNDDGFTNVADVLPRVSEATVAAYVKEADDEAQPLPAGEKAQDEPAINWNGLPF